MSEEEKGLSLALSLGGRAGRIARAFPVPWLNDRYGLARLMASLEAELGPGAQEMVRQSMDAWSKFSRARGTSLADYCTAFDICFAEAASQGLQMNNVGRSHALISKANLTSSDEQTLLVQVQWDYNRYDDIRRIMRKMSVDGKAAQTFVVQPTNDSGPCMNLMHTNLNQPPAVAVQHHPPPAPYAAPEQAWPTENSEWQAEEWYEEEEDDGAEDYVSLRSEDSEQTDGLILNCWAVTQKGRKAFKKGGGKGKSKSKGKSKGGGAPFDKNAPPPGFPLDKWLARSPCPGCGSRWHRNCSDRAGKSKGKGKGKGKTVHFASPGSTNQLATLWPVQWAHKPIACFPAAPLLPANVTVTKATRFGLVVDTGAVTNVVGSAWVDRFSTEFLQQHEANNILMADNDTSFRGIGSGTQNSETEA
jgi:hypothetical protein